LSRGIFCFNINLDVYSLDANGLNYLPILFYNIDNNNYYNIPFVILNYNSHIKHYNLLFYNKMISITKNNLNSSIGNIENNAPINKEINTYTEYQNKGTIKNK